MHRAAPANSSQPDLHRAAGLSARAPAQGRCHRPAACPHPDAEARPRVAVIDPPLAPTPTRRPCPTSTRATNYACTTPASGTTTCCSPPPSFLDHRMADPLRALAHHRALGRRWSHPHHERGDHVPPATLIHTLFVGGVNATSVSGSFDPSRQQSRLRTQRAKGNRRSHKRNAPEGDHKSSPWRSAIARSVRPSCRRRRRAASPYVRYAKPRLLRCGVKTRTSRRANPVRKRPNRAIRRRSVPCRVALLRFRTTDKSRTNDQEAGHPAWVTGL